MSAKANGSVDRGKRIYTEGTANAGEINALVGEEQAVLPASALPCGSCHGSDGLGRAEGGLNPSDIRWRELTKSYGHLHEDGRQHPAYDRQSLATLILTGVDPAGNRIDSAMPRYQIPAADMADLLAYLEHLEHDVDPGITADQIQVGTLLPLTGPGAGVGQAMAQVMHAYFQEVNAGGGLFGRRLELLAVPTGVSAQTSISNLHQAFAAEGIFAVVGAYTVGIDQPLLELLRADQVPLIGPFTLDPGDAFADSAAFYLYPGFDDQARVLADRALAQAGGEAALLIGPEAPRIDQVIHAAADQLRRSEAPEPTILRYAQEDMSVTDLAADIQASGSDDMIFFGGRAELTSLLHALEARGYTPRVYVLSSLLAGSVLDAPAGFSQRLFIAYPTHMTDLSSAGRDEYRTLAERHALPREHVQAQIAALAAVKLFTEGLQRAGRDLSRERLVESLESLYGFSTGLTQPLTYGPNLRIGARGAHLLAVDLEKGEYVPVDGGWHQVR